MGAKCKGCGSCILFIVTTVVVYKLSLPVFMENFDPEGDTPSDTRFLPKADRSYSGRHLICHKFAGDLGSMLFQYASLLGLAQRQNRLLVAVGDVSLERILKVTKFKKEKSHCRSVVHVTEVACCRVDNALLQLDREKNYEIEGELHSWKYFKDYMENIRESVVFHEGVVLKAKQIIERALRSNNHSVTNSAIVGIHVKRGENLHWNSIDAGYRVAPREYFIKAMKYFREHNSGQVVFLVVTDDQEWCKSNLLGLPGVILLRQHQPVEDLAVLSLLDHSIISVGSFSWWAAFLNKGTVIYYRDFVDNDSKARREYDPKFEDYVLPEWIPMA